MRLLRYYLGHVVRDYLPRGLGQQAQKLRRSTTARWEGAKRVWRLKRHGRFTPAQLYDGLIASGVKTGVVTLVHSSFGEFTNFSGTALDVLDVLHRVVGPEGTLIMPAQYVSKKDRFDALRHPASVGILCELFRRQPGVSRSLHPGQSVCALGPLARELTREHHTDPLGCGPRSPFAKLLDVDSQVLGLGLPPLWTTFLHVVEDLDPTGFPWEMYNSKVRRFTVVDSNGDELLVDIPLRREQVLARINPRKLAQYVSDRAQWSFQVHGLPCFVAEPQPLYRELKALAGKGITAYGRLKTKAA